MTVMRATGERPAVCRRFAPHQVVHGHGVEMAREGLPLNVIQRQFGRTDLGVTSVYLEGIDNDEGDQRRPPPPGADDAGGRGSAVSATGSEIIEGISAWSSRKPGTPGTPARVSANTPTPVPWARPFRSLHPKAHIARLITGAALIIVVVFAGFAAGELVSVQQMGFGVAGALLVGATIVRSVVTPAAMRLLGERNCTCRPGSAGCRASRCEASAEGSRAP